MSRRDDLKALRGSKKSETRDLSPAPVRARRDRLARPEATRVSAAEIAKDAQEAVLPSGVTDVRLAAFHTVGERLPSGDFSGLGGKTLYGPVWMIDGGITIGEPIALYEHQRDASALYEALVGPEGELWQRKQRRLEAIAAAEAAEAAAAEIAKENAKTVRRSGGDGSPPPRRSSETTSVKPHVSRRERLRQASKTTPSR